MARRKAKGGGGGGSAGWLVTFSDLMTLLLTFFVLLLSMASMDSTTLSRISSFSSSVAIIEHAGAGKMPERVQMLMELLRDPESITNKQERIKDLLFPHDLLPPEIMTGTLKENLRVLQHPEGVVIVLTEGLLFARDSARLDSSGRALLTALTPVMQAMNVDINISGYTDDAPGAGVDSYELSGLRALAALEYFLQGGLRPDRFSISGYGPDKPLFPNNTEEGRMKNRRVEILLKTAKRAARYV